MAYKCLALIVLCATVLALSSPAQARDLLIDRTITNCREYGKPTEVRSAVPSSGVGDWSAAWSRQHDDLRLVCLL